MIFLNINNELNDANVRLEKFDINKPDMYKTSQDLAVYVETLLEFIYLSKTAILYAVCSANLAPTLQEHANNYLLDIKVIAKIKTKDQIETIAKMNIDGVIIA